MSLLFKTEFLGHPLHVLDIRGRAAFFALELGAAAGHRDGGDRFVTLLTREWAELLDDDDDVAFLTAREFARVRTETGLPLTARGRLVLFAPGVRKALAKSEARLARPLQTFLDEAVYPQVATSGPVGEAKARCPSEPGPSLAPAPVPVDRAAEREAFVRRGTEYLALRRYAHLEFVHRKDVDVYLLLERLAVEALLGRGLWADPDPTAPATSVAA